MALYINTNVASLTAQANLSRTQQSLNANLGRLSSGSRINSAADDAAGLGISESLRGQIGGLQQASRNANDGVSMAQIAEGAMNQQASILTRLRSLAVQSANGTLATTERNFIETERVALNSEIDRIANVTDFQGVQMLGAGSGSVTMQIGTYGTTNDQISITFNKTDSTSLGVNALSFSTATGAQAAIATLDTAINSLSTDRATVGAGQNRLNVAVNNLSSQTLNLQAADSRVRDVDVAEETAALTRNQVLSQAGVAVLSQANQLPSLALQLLR
jgi:flagellin